ncbi:nuclear transport factor 2 family protein [Flavobacterium selenitireducens]|uniref:nuclear transport factor 2 family protein n=1 Tax=Flavobacterium selenitireducens TaxID=2722704 RepID=UPI00168B48B8|nr:nuclear transport factor 2 family protein [Flavobacterium selenitireducens]MBD3581449.1 SnoaL-like domain-containing protein [Flavobacterium selenitireducens]
MDNKSILEKANAAIEKGDYEGFLAFCTADTTWEFIGDKTLTGKEAVREWMASEYLEPPRFAVENMIAANEFVTAIGTISLTDSDGKSTNYSYCDVWLFRDGKMAQLKAFVIAI